MNDNDIYVVGKDKAITSLVLGIVSVLSFFTLIGSIIGVVTGIIGLIFAIKAKKEGYYGGLQTGGFVSSLVGLIVSIITTIFLIILVSSFFTFLSEAVTYGMYTWY